MITTTENTPADTLPTHKACTKCGEVKALGEFHLSKRGKYGRSSYCGVCKSIHTHERYVNNPIIQEQARARTDRFITTAPSGEKACTKCGCVKPLYEFQKEKLGRFGRRGECKACRSPKMNVYKKHRFQCDPVARETHWMKKRERSRKLANPAPVSSSHLHDKQVDITNGIAFRITLRLPSAVLCSNLPPLTPGGRMAVSQCAKRYRAHAAEKCRHLNHPEDGPPALRRASAKLYFFFKDKRRRDIRNFEAGMKAAYDGLVDGGLIIDDNSEVLTHEETVFDIDPQNPRVEIIITNLEAAA